MITDRARVVELHGPAVLADEEVEADRLPRAAVLADGEVPGPASVGAVQHNGRGDEEPARVAALNELDASDPHDATCARSTPIFVFISTNTVSGTPKNAASFAMLAGVIFFRADM